MRLSVDMSGLQAALDDGLARAEHAVTAAMREATVGLKEDLRDETFKHLGVRVAYAWQGETYPNTGASLEPSAYVFSKAPKIISFFSAERVITPIGGGFAIPVNPIVKRGGRPMTIAEVETRFNQDLQPRRLPSGNIGLFADLVRARSERRPGYRNLTAGRKKKGRSTELILMFVLVRHLRGRKLVDVLAAGERWAGRVPGLIQKHLAEIE